MTKSWPVFSSLLLAAVTPAAEPPRETVDRIVAVIEDEVITLRQLEDKAAPYLEKLAGVKDAAERDKKRMETLRQVLDIEIGERIVSAEIERNKDRLGVTEQDIDRAVQEVQRMNNISREQLEAALYGQGMTWTEYRQKLRAQVERARLIQFQVQGKVQVKDGDAVRRCEERQRAGTKELKICASHILRKIPPDASADAVEKLRTRLSQLQAELSAGADFAAYALKNSDDKAAPDGELGCFGRGEMLPEFETAAYKLKVGEVSAVIRTKLGFHIIKVTDRKQAASASCSDDTVLNNFRNEIYQEEVERQMNTWLAELRRKAFVEVRL